MLTAVDYGVMVFYAGLVLGLGIFAKSMVHNLDDYFAAGRRVPWWMAAISHHMSGYSAFVFVGYASVAYKLGFNIWTLSALPVSIALVIGAFVWAPRWVRLQVLTPIEYLERRFNNLVRQLCAWSGILIKFVDEGTKLYSLALIVHVSTGIRQDLLIIGCGVVAIFYVMIGGLWADILTDLGQFFVQFSITLLMVPLVLKTVGGWNEMWRHLPAGHSSFFSKEYDFSYIFVFLFVIVLSYNGGTWGLAQRFYSIGKPKDAQKAALLSAFLFLVYPLVIYIPVWAAPLVIGKTVESEQVYILMAQRFLPTIAPGLMGLMISAMFAATMSMVDSDINALAAVFTKDIYQRTFNPQASEAKLLKVGLIATVIFGALTIATGLATPGLGKAFKAMMEWYAALLGPVTIPLLLGMLVKRTTWRGAIASWIGGFLAFCLCKYGFKTSWTVYTGVELIVSSALFLIDGYIFRQTPDEKRRVEELFAQLKGL